MTPVIRIFCLAVITGGGDGIGKAVAHQVREFACQRCQRVLEETGAVKRKLAINLTFVTLALTSNVQV